MGGPRTAADVVTAERKEYMRGNYQEKKVQYNMNKLIRELETQKRLFVQRRTVEKYPWSAEHLAIINRANELYTKERTLPRPIINLPAPAVWPPPRVLQEVEQYPDPALITDRTYTQSMAEAFLRTRKKRDGEPIKQSTTDGHIRKIPALLELFGVKSSDLMEIYDQVSVKDISAKIVSNNAVWVETSTQKAYIGFGGILTEDPLFRGIIGKEKSNELRAEYRKYRDKATLQTKATKEKVDYDYRDVYFKLFEAVDQYEVGTQQHAIAMLYTYGMYRTNMAGPRESKGDGNKLVIVPRNYFHSVLVVKSESEITEAGNYYLPVKGRMVLNEFKTSKQFSFDYILPKKARESVNAYIRRNNNTWLIEKVRGGKYGHELDDFEGEGKSSNGLAARVKTVLGYKITTIRPVVENYEVRSLKEDRDEVASAMAHSVVTQEQQYLQKSPWEETANYVGRRVELPIFKGRNKGKIIQGTLRLNDGSNKSYPPAQRPYKVVFDKKFKEETEMVSFPEPDIKFIDGAAPSGASASPSPPQPAAAKRKSKPKGKPQGKPKGKPKGKPQR